MLPNSIYTVSMALILELGKDTTQKGKLQARVTDEQRCKNHQQNISKLNLTSH